MQYKVRIFYLYLPLQPENLLVFSNFLLIFDKNKLFRKNILLPLPLTSFSPITNRNYATAQTALQRQTEYDKAGKHQQNL